MSTLHDRLIEGDGSREAPFVFHTASYMLSAQIQNEILDRLFGAGAWTTDSRTYFESQRGTPGNGDLCEYAVIVNGERRPVWFDLYLVTRLVNDPELNKAKREFSESPAGRKIGEEMLKMLSGGANKRSGCLSIIILAIAVTGICVIFLRQ